MFAEEALKDGLPVVFLGDWVGRTSGTGRLRPWSRTNNHREYMRYIEGPYRKYSMGQSPTI